MSQENVEIVRATRIKLSPLGERAGQRRSLDEQLFVRFPAALRLFSEAFTRLPAQSRLRRLLLARSVRRGYAAGNRRDFDVLVMRMDAENEYRPSRDLMPPDVEHSFHGHAGFIQLWRYWMDAFEDIRWDPEEIIDLGDRFLVSTHQSGHGSGSGVAMSEPVFQLFTLRRGFVVRQEDFLDRSKALAAAGLRE
jgi:ketosteroid isomerase-like protein